MRTSAQIATKMELLDSKNWPHAKAGWLVLREYHIGRKKYETSVLRDDLDNYIEDNWRILREGTEQDATIAHVRVQTIIWLMGNDDLLEGLSRIPRSGEREGIKDRLEVIHNHYGIPIPESESEEK